MRNILITDNLVNRASCLKLEIGPKVDINSDHDYLQLDMYFGKKRKSRNEMERMF